jgi:hypothetical protein
VFGRGFAPGQAVGVGAGLHDAPTGKTPGVVTTHRHSGSGDRAARFRGPGRSYSVLGIAAATVRNNVKVRVALAGRGWCLVYWLALLTASICATRPDLWGA